VKQCIYRGSAQDCSGVEYLKVEGLRSLPKERSSNIHDGPDVGLICLKRFVKFLVDRLSGLTFEAVRNLPNMMHESVVS